MPGLGKSLSHNAKAAGYKVVTSTDLSSPVVISEAAGATRKRGPRSWRGLPFVLPYLPLLIVFGIPPTIYALDLAVTHVDGSWAGYRNFVDTYNDFRFIDAFKHVLVYPRSGSRRSWCSSSASRCSSTASANRVSTTFRFLFYIPGALAGAASVVYLALHARSERQPRRGSSCTGCSGRDSFAQSIAAQNLPFIFAMIAFWTGAGGWIVVMYGALNTIPHGLEEAARIDGAGADRDRSAGEAPVDPQVDRLHVDPVLRDRDAAFVETADRAERELRPHP